MTHQQDVIWGGHRSLPKDATPPKNDPPTLYINKWRQTGNLEGGVTIKVKITYMAKRGSNENAKNSSKCQYSN